MSYILTKSGLLVDGEESTTLSDLIKKYKKQIEKKNEDFNRVDYLEETGKIRIRTYYETYIIQLDEEQKFKYENGISDPVINQVRDFLEYNAKKSLEEEIVKNANRGELPTDSQKINVYSKYLNKELLKTGAPIAKKCALTFWPLLIIGISIPLWKSGLTSSDYNLGQLQLALAVLSDIFGVVISTIKGIHVFDRTDSADFIDNIKELLKKLKVLILKKNDLRLHLKDIEKLPTVEEDYNNYLGFIQEKRNKEATTAVKYSDKTIKDMAEIIDLIGKLTDKRLQEKYYQQMIDLVRKYREGRISSLTREQTLISDEASEVRSLRLETTPNLINIKSDIEALLQKQEEVIRVDSQCNELINTAATAYTQALLQRKEEDQYNTPVVIEQPTDSQGWSDDLTQENVMRMS